ncbi:MAG: hypothetical protein ACFNUJ_07740, partial [Campylobacter curvus]
IRVKTLLASLSPPIFTSCYALVTFCFAVTRRSRSKTLLRGQGSGADRGLLAAFQDASLRSQLQSRSEASVNDLLKQSQNLSSALKGVDVLQNASQTLANSVLMGAVLKRNMHIKRDDTK